ncbi:large ribosomal subunit protein uL30z-like [Cicer arietinum]|uniref:60S ribosomal protein L7-1-like n=1 Tax=Cicer arietinum TaxID=3827 RepID=A0A1S3EFW8_CICAR|nr:60S ribosomal protein L7-1-like [Cicer arietinum]
MGWVASEEEPKALNYVPEVILKKRKNSETWALRKKAQFQQKGGGPSLNETKAQGGQEETLYHLSFVPFMFRKQDMHPTTRKHLLSLGLRRIFSAVLVKPTDGVMAKLLRVEPYVTYGFKSIKKLIYKKGRTKIDKQKVPLTDNNIIEQELGKFGIVCIEDTVHQIDNVGPHFKEVVRFMWPFDLNKPADGLKGSKS